MQIRPQTRSLDGSRYNGEEECGLGVSPRGATPGNLPSLREAAPAGDASGTPAFLLPKGL